MAYLNLLKALWHYAGASRWKVALYFILHALSQIATLLQPFVFAQILNSLQLQQSQILPTVVMWLAAWIGLFVWFQICHRIAQYFVYDTAYRAKQACLNEYYEVATQLPLQWHTDNHSGSTINRINTAAGSLHDFATNQYKYIEYMMLFWGPLVALWFLSWQVSVAAFATAIISILVMRLFDKRLIVLYRTMNDRQHKIASVFYDYISNIKTIITLRLGQRTKKEFDHQIEHGYQPYMKAESNVNQWKWLTVSMSVLLLEAGVIFYYIWQQLNAGEVILVGTIVAVFQYLQQLSRTYMSIASDYQGIIASQTNYESVEPIKAALVEDSQSKLKAKDWQHLTITGLNFNYGTDKPTLHDISLTFAKGERIALVGESGSGKSSLMAVLRGLYEPQSVQLDLDGKAFTSLAPLHAVTTLIPQEPEVFENTIGYNITIGIDYPEAQVLEAVRLACFDKILERLPDGLQADVREKGVTLSGGERQRLALARGILAAENSSIILMDEPTSSVDAQNEMMIYDNLFAHFVGGTIVSSIHRLHLLSRFDRIVIMDKGEIVQVGSFNELQANPGLFQTLWNKYKENT